MCAIVAQLSVSHDMRGRILAAQVNSLDLVLLMIS